jgi:phosphatidylserine/phosphatidylglycerophosphate/cardiolipin synthase-like enzyme
MRTEPVVPARPDHTPGRRGLIGLWGALLTGIVMFSMPPASSARTTTTPAPVATRPAATAVPMPPPSAHATVDVFFSPGGRTDRAVADLIDGARVRVWIAGYYFTSSTIARALDQAFRRGVDVRVVLDRSQATLTYSSATYFHNQGVPLWINARYPVMHHKFLVVDEDTVGFGSMNFTQAGARHNAENFNLFRHWTALAGTYAGEFDRLRQESVPYSPGMVFEDRVPDEAPH